MSTLNRLIGMAGKALGQQSSTSGSASGGDWRRIVRTAADRITGDDRAAAAPIRTPASVRPAPASGPGPGAAPGAHLSADDRRAIARYDYLVQTAEPHDLERIHRDAFARLSPDQRAEVESRMRRELPPTEQPRSGSTDDLARAATRSELLRPGSIRGLLGRAGGSGRGIGGAVAGAGVGLAAGGILATIAGGAVLSSVAGPLLEQAAGLGVDLDALAGDIDLGAITGVDELASGVGDRVSGVGDAIGNLGEQASEFQLPDLGDLFGR